ncbi:MAG: sugar ABC transporter ATP-binding protein [Myxococcales bacterium]|jgi:D-xylose transport system ATP-binding protein|nr:sugar ABC transporter ATP-binding protein [Myxococcales bacterium]HRC57378.1 ATP-binding cassette domain-containing protein [Kofleriaceae bacterium]
MQEPSAATPLLEMQGISKRFGAVQALQDVHFQVLAGEVMALVGDNGAGKSTLIKAIAGIYQPDAGVTRWMGREVTVRTPNDAAALGIATVYQDLALCDNLDVVANLYLGRELASPGGPLGLLDEVAMEKRAIEVLRKLSVKIPSVRIPIASLSGGQRQSVAVARSVMGDNKVVLLDEPTAALGVAQTREVLGLIKRLREQGLGVVLISHNLSDVFEVADRITVLRLGRWVGTYEAKDLGREKLVAIMTGAISGDAVPGATPPAPVTAEHSP